MDTTKRWVIGEVNTVGKCACCGGVKRMVNLSSVGAYVILCKCGVAVYNNDCEYLGNVSLELLK